MSKWKFIFEEQVPITCPTQENKLAMMDMLFQNASLGEVEAATPAKAFYSVCNIYLDPKYHAGKTILMQSVDFPDEIYRFIANLMWITTDATRLR